MSEYKWSPPQTITGPPAEGDKYFERLYIEEELWREVDKGVHILIAAPRRVGKTSIMKEIARKGKVGYFCIFENIQSLTTKDGFYKRLYFLILNQLGSLTKLKKHLISWLATRGIEGITWEGGIKFKTKNLIYKDELLALIAKLPEFDQKIVLLIDEFSEVIFRVISKEDKESAIDILHTIREIRSKSEFKNCIFVLSGSVGLDHVVGSIDRLTLINDLHPLKVNALSKDEAREFIGQLLEGATMNVGENEKNHIIKKIKHLVPYFIQLVIEECNNLLTNAGRKDLTEEDINIAFANVIKNERNLQDWEDRLKPPYLTKKAFQFCKEVLTTIAHHSQLTILEIYNLSIKHGVKDDYMNHTKMLVFDGYLTEEKEDEYQFISPLLQTWWQKQHPKFEIENT